MFGIPLSWTLGATGALAVFVFWSGYHMGDTYGSNARAYAAIKRELDDTNAKVRSEKAEDEAALREQAVRADKAFDEASVVLLKLGKDCKAQKDAANILNGAR